MGRGWNPSDGVSSSNGAAVFGQVLVAGHGIALDSVQNAITEQGFANGPIINDLCANVSDTLVTLHQYT